MTREEPTLETMCLQNTETMYKDQRVERSNTAPSSKTFSDEQTVHVPALEFDVWSKIDLPKVLVWKAYSCVEKFTYPAKDLVFFDEAPP
jgi:hypothetical protein